MLEHPIVQLPPQLTSFVGRADEIIQIAQQLDNPDCRLLTLVGTGGIGKTRLAIEIASKKSNNFPDGIYFVDLQPVSAIDSLVTTIANSIDMHFFGEQPPHPQLLNFLSDRNLLLLIDNFEHLLDGVDLLTEIVKTAPNVKLLVTSREALNVQEEWVWQVKGLQVPERTHVGSIENFSAVRLFTERARRVRADFVLDSQEDSVIRICHLVEGMPLALELAASWTKVLSCDEIGSEIQRGLDFLKTNVRNIPERHRNIQAVFEWSWRLLTDEEREVFPRLSVFRDGFRREAAKAVAGASLQTLVGLVDKSFLRVSESGRYTIHELMRQYGEQLLEQTGQKTATQDRHCAYYAGFLHEREAQLTGQDQIVTLDEIAEEIDNVRVSWEWAITYGKRTEVEQCGFSLFRFGHIRMKTIAGESAVDRAIKRFGQEKSTFLAYLLLSKQWYTLENGKALNQESIQKAIRLLLKFKLQEKMAQAVAIVCAGGDAVRYDNSEELHSFFLQNLMVFRARNELWGAAWLLYSLGEYASYYHKYDEAETYQRESRAIFKSLEDAWASAWPIGALSIIFKRSGKYDEALLMLQEHQLISQEMSDVYGRTWSLSIEGEIALEMQNFERAERCLIRGLEIIKELGTNYHGLTSLLELLPHILTGESKIEPGIELLAFLHRDAQKIGADIYAETYEQILNVLNDRLPFKKFQQAVERSKTLDLKSILERLLTELSSRSQNGTISHQRSPITERELEILRLIADGLQNQEIADQLFVALGTVKAHINAIYRKLDVANRVQAVSHAREIGLL